MEKKQILEQGEVVKRSLLMISSDLATALKQGIVQTSEGVQEVVVLRTKRKEILIDALQLYPYSFLQKIDGETCVQSINLLEGIIARIQKGDLSLSSQNALQEESDDNQNKKLVNIRKVLEKLNILKSGALLTGEVYEEVAEELSYKSLSEEVFLQLNNEVQALLKDNQFKIIDENTCSPQDRGYRFLKMISTVLKRSPYYQDPILILHKTNLQSQQPSELSKKITKFPKISKEKNTKPKEPENTTNIPTKNSLKEKIRELLKIFRINDIDPKQSYQQIFSTVQRAKLSYEELHDYATKLNEYLENFPLGDEEGLDELETFADTLLTRIQGYEDDTPRGKKLKCEKQNEEHLQEERKIFVQAYHREAIPHLCVCIDEIYKSIKKDNFSQDLMNKLLAEAIAKIDAHEDKDSRLLGEYESLQKIYAQMNQDHFNFAFKKGFLLGDLYEFFNKKIDEGTLTWETLPASIIDKVKKYREEL